jgi:hypothetical protein
MRSPQELEQAARDQGYENDPLLTEIFSALREANARPAVAVPARGSHWPTIALGIGIALCAIASIAYVSSSISENAKSLTAHIDTSAATAGQKELAALNAALSEANGRNKALQDIVDRANRTNGELASENNRLKSDNIYLLANQKPPEAEGKKP